MKRYIVFSCRKDVYGRNGRLIRGGGVVPAGGLNDVYCIVDDLFDYEPGGYAVIDYQAVDVETGDIYEYKETIPWYPCWIKTKNLSDFPDGGSFPTADMLEPNLIRLNIEI